MLICRNITAYMTYVRRKLMLVFRNYVNMEIHMLTHCLYNDKLMLIFPNIKMPRQNTCLHTICKTQVNVNIPKYTYADVNATVRMFILRM